MRLAELAFDVASVLKASRSVAVKHISLRNRQLGAFYGGSSNKSTWKSGGARDERVTGSVQKDTPTSPKTKYDVPAVSASDQCPRPQKTSGRNLRKVIHTSDGPSFQRIHQDTACCDEGERDHAPPGVNLGIFHTARGSKLMEALREAEDADIGGIETATRPAKEHPLRHWPYGPSANTRARSISHENPAQDKIGTAPSYLLPFNTFSAEGYGAQATPREPASSTQEQGVGMGEAGKLSIEEANATAGYKLRESKVPASRLSRLWNYGGLAAGMLGGAMTESVSRAFGGGGQGSLMLSGKNMERLVTKLSRMRGAPLKLGQMMSLQDSKMLPGPIQEVLQRVQDKADYMPAWQRDRVLVSNLGDDWRALFSQFDENPMAAASIGQVHKAVLKSNGRKVAVKIQFPGVATSIDSDLNNLGILLNATKLLPKGLYLNKTIDNARVELGWECDYEREAQCARRYKKLLKDEDVLMAPDVYAQASGKQVLTMDFMEGEAVTQVRGFTQEQRDWIGTHILRLCLREITEFRFMQTDPNWTNFLYNRDMRKLALVDFGASRDYAETFVRQYVQLLEAASRDDRQAVRRFSQMLGYLTGHESKTMVDAHIDSVLTLAEPFRISAPRVYDFQDQTITDRVRGLIPVMLRERLAPPPEETYSLHRKLSGAFLLCARLGSRVACKEMFASAVAKSGYVKKA